MSFNNTAIDEETQEMHHQKSVCTDCLQRQLFAIVCNRLLHVLGNFCNRLISVVPILGSKHHLVAVGCSIIRLMLVMYQDGILLS